MRPCSDRPDYDQVVKKHLMSQVTDRTKEWLRGPFDRYRDYVEQTFRLVSLAILGISRMTNDHQLTEAIINYDMVTSDIAEQTPDQQSQIAEARKRAELAAQEVEQGFPLLCGHTIVGLWGAFEAAIENFLTRWIVYSPSSLEDISQIRLRVPATDFMQASDQERARLLLAELSRNLQADARLGISRFEELLNRFNLGGNPKDEVKREVFEMQQVRHIWAHRGGLADAQFKDRCPWFDVDVEQLVKVDMKKVEDYGSATIYYVIDIWKRVP
jgi:hypothetical protein